MRWLSLFFIAACGAGCVVNSKPMASGGADAAPSTPAPTAGRPSSPTPYGSGAATGLTPMTGTENVGGAGMGGAGTAAKDQARRAAGAAGASSLGTGAEGE